MATVRRWAAVGKLPARKSGKQWLIDGTRLTGQPRRKRVSATPIVDVEQALAHVRKTDLSETWVPDVLRHADELADKASLLASAEGRFRGSPPAAAIEIEVDKTVIFTRWAVLLELADRVAYQAAVASFADRVEAQTPDPIYSARLSSDPRYFLKRGTTQWVAWRREILARVNAGKEWMVKTDLTSYFDTIPHKLLLAEIETLNAERAVVDALAEMLRAWAPVPGQGLPQGPNASRLLGNLYMLPVDRAMLAAGWEYWRYLDDIRIVTATKAEAVEAVRQLQKECRARGLIISSNKTELLFGDDARADLEEEKDLAVADYFMNANVSALARKQLKAILKRALKPNVGVDERRAKFSLWRLALLRDGGMLRRVLNRLEDLAPVASVVAAYLRPFITQKRVVGQLSDFFADSARSHSVHLKTWLLAVMLEHPGPLPVAWVDEAVRHVADRNQPAFLRAVAAVVMARGNRAADLAWIKNEIQREHDPAVLRGYAVGLHWAHELDRTTQKRLITRSSRLAATIQYLQGRVVLPSLIYRDTRLRIQ